ncbi:MAG: SGNH/GDSL hydrolase family protein [Bacillota bacterium]|nr:SGNH/GDSL hydrolase family protein [Bacillota bacterium]
MKKLFKSFLFLLIVSLVFTTSAFAKSEHAKKSLVALGDSIPFGYNLEDENAHPSRDAFPFKIGDEADLRVRDLGIPGLKTDGLLTLLQHDQEFREAVRHADYITLNIGNNDLLAALKQAYVSSNGNPQLLNYYLMQYIQSSNVFANLSQIVAEIRQLTNAPVLLYNFYNPFQLTDPLHYLAKNVLPEINGQLNGFVALANLQLQNIVLGDAYTAFGENQAKYVLANDIHPTLAGHTKLAEVGLLALGLKK